jgi:hypothetical protein
MPSKKKKNNNVTKGVAIGAGLVAMAAAGYLLFGPKGKQNRTKIKGWTLKAKGDVLEAIEKLDHVTEDKYHAIVERVAKKYAKAKNTTKAEVARFEKDARKHWKAIEKDLAKKTAKTAKKVAAKASKRATKK